MRNELDPEVDKERGRISLACSNIQVERIAFVSSYLNMCAPLSGQVDKKGAERVRIDEI